jgi:hypothetical protein
VKDLFTGVRLDLVENAVNYPRQRKATPPTDRFSALAEKRTKGIRPASWMPSNAPS